MPVLGRMAKLADAIALGAIGATLGGSNPLPPINLISSQQMWIEVISNNLCGGNSAVECLLAKQDATGSNPVRRSI